MTAILPKWRSTRAFELYEDLKYAPGNTPPLPPREPSRPSRHRNMKLEAADAEITRCVYCGNWHKNRPKQLCDWCAVNPFPTIDDLGASA